METNLNEISINGVTYVPKTSITQPSTDYVIVRTYSAGVFAGYIESRSEDGKKVLMRHARCLWYWAGAASLMQLAVDGVSKPDECKFTKIVDKMEATEVIEVLYCTETAKIVIEAVKEWTA